MNLNYRSVPFYLLSLFSIIFLLSLTGSINSRLAMNYSIIGIIACIAAWIADGKIIHKAEGITHTGVYIPDVDDSDIHNILGQRITLVCILSGVLLFSFIISIIIF